MVDYEQAEQDPNFPLEEYGELYVVPSTVGTSIDAKTTEMLNAKDLESATDYYSNIPGGDDKKFSMDFYGGKPVDQGTPASAPANPRYVREGTFLNIFEKDGAQ